MFNIIEQGKRLKKEDQLPGSIPFVMAGSTNTGVVNYISNPVAMFPENSITIDIFGNTFYRNYAFGAGDDTGVYWNTNRTYSKATMLFLAISINKALSGKFSFGNKLRSSRSFKFKILLPIKNSDIDFEFMEKFISELEAERIAELEAERITELETYLLAAGLTDYELTEAEKFALDDYESLEFDDYSVVDIFKVNNTKNILSREIVKNSGTTPYLCASSENNAVNAYISYNEKLLDAGNCIFIGGKTFVVTYQEHDFYSNDSHNLVLYLKDEDKKRKLNQLYLATCVNKSLKHKYSWGDSISNKKIQTDKIFLPKGHKQPNYTIMETFISAIQKLVIQDTVYNFKRKIAVTKAITKAED